MPDTGTHTVHRSDRSAPRLGEHAIVIGASIAGLLAARVLSDSYDRVTLVDRDRLSEALSEHRRAVPQGVHAHGLQAGGQAALEQLFPGLRDEALEAGGEPLRGTRVTIGGNRLPRFRVGPDFVVTSRPVLEGLLRRRVRALANVTIRDRCSVVGLASDGARVTGVLTSDRDAGSALQTLCADLVVAARARARIAPAPWR